MRKWIPLLTVVGLIALAPGCQNESGGSLTDQAGKLAEDTTKLATDAGAAAQDAGADMLKQAEAAAGKLGAEAKAMYDEYATKLKSKSGELAKLEEKLSSMAPKDLTSGDGTALKDQVKKLEAEIAELKTKLQALIDKAV